MRKEAYRSLIVTLTQSLSEPKPLSLVLFGGLLHAICDLLPLLQQLQCRLSQTRTCR